MLKKFVEENAPALKSIATAVRTLGMDAVLAARSGHTGLPLGGADIGTLLYFAAMRHNPADPNWIDRDRFVLSAGHGSMLQYALLHLAGYEVDENDLRHFRQLGSRTPGHPEYGHTQGVETTTGPLGQGFATAVGMAIAERMLAARFNLQSGPVIDHRTFVIAGDGCLMEGVTSEACSLAGHLRLNRLIVIYDDNRITIDGPASLSFSEDVALRYEAYGWQVLQADGNDFASLAGALDRALEFSHNESCGPTLVVCRTIPGKGSPKWEGKHKVHGNPMSAEDVEDAKRHLGCAGTAPFEVKEEARAAARTLVARKQSDYAAWQKSLADIRAEWRRAGDARETLWREMIEAPRTGLQIPDEIWHTAAEPVATRTAGGEALVALAAQDPRLVGGSADLAGSTLTTLPDTRFVAAGDFQGRNLHFGVREHGMAAATNGMALHGGLRPYCATFAVFSDYLKPSLRLAALMGVPAIYIFTHDSIGVGEDGPTHQPIEHLAALRALPGLHVFRPADATETYAAWELALAEPKQPTALFLTRQNLPVLPLDATRTIDQVRRGVKEGAYLLKDFGNKKSVTLVASGSEVHLAMAAAAELEKDGLGVRVVSAPAPERLAANRALLDSLIPRDTPAVAIEAAARLGWGDIVGRDGLVIAMETFGASGPAEALFPHFGFAPQAVRERVLAFLDATR